MTSISNFTFYGCTGLTSIDIPTSITSIGRSAFSGCSSLTSIDIPNSVTSIGAYAFSGCGRLTYVDIPSSISKIEDGTFFYCSGLISINIPNSVTKIGSQTNFSYYDQGAFGLCSSLISINIPSSVTSIGGCTFCECERLTSITIPNSVTIIGDLAFVDCKRLNYINIPNSVTSIGEHAFRNCRELKAVTVGWRTPLAIQSDVFELINLNEVKLIVPKATKSIYQTANVWKNFNPIEEIVPTKYTVTYNNPYGGNIQVINGADIVMSGEKVEKDTELTVRATPNAGFALKSLTLNGQDIDNGHTFRIDKAVDIRVVFSTATALDEAAAKPLALYPNPMADVLYLSATARTIRIYDMYGTEVAHAADTDKVEVSHLPAGIYTVKADDTVAKMVKR